MKTFLLLFSAVISACSTSIAQTPDWLWAKSIGGTDVDAAYSIKTDASANVYLAGTFFSDSITFDSITLFNHADYADIFLAKYDSSGNILWATNPTGTNYNTNINLNSMTIDLNGNIYFTGGFSNDSITFGAFTLTNKGMFLVKYDANGNVLWANSTDGGSGNSFGSYANSVTTDSQGNICVSGYFYDSFITFGSTSLFNTDSFGSTTDVFLVKYNQSGNVLWATSTGAIDYDIIISSAADFGGNIYVAGLFYHTDIIFGTDTLVNPYPAWPDIFLVKYDPSGNVLWAKSAGGNDWDGVNSITIDGANNIYITGDFYSDSISFGSITLANCGYEGMFLIKYDSGGNYVWMNCVAGGVGTAIAEDSLANIYVSGSFGADTIIFGLDTLINATTGGAFSDIFIVKYDSSGYPLWAKSSGGLYSDGSSALSLDEAGNIYVAGGFQSPIIAFDSTVLSNAGMTDFFIAKLNILSATGNDEIKNFGSGIYLYPNPFSNSTTLFFSLSHPQNISIKVFDINGRLVSTLADKIFEAGENEISWNAADVNAGIYFLQFLREESFGQSTEILQTKKLIITK